MKAEVFRDGEYWGVRIGATAVLREESYQVASNVAHAIETGATGTSECDEVAAAILKRAGMTG